MMCFHGDKQLAREIGLHDMTMTPCSRRMSIDVDLLRCGRSRPHAIWEVLCMIREPCHIRLLHHGRYNDDR
jgi:hypothetical protein